MLCTPPHVGINAITQNSQYLHFWEFLYIVSNSGGKKKILRRDLLVPATISHTMPQPSKRSVQAKSQRLAGSTSFGTAQTTASGSDTGSVDSSESEGSVFSSDGENDTTALESLYRNILPKKLKVNQAKSKKRGRHVRYNGDSRTTAWRQQKKWKGASQGCQKMDTYFQVST